MENIVQMIMQRYPLLTDGEKKIADILLDSSTKSFTLGIKELSTKANVSMATVSRFAHHLGFDTYKQLQIALATGKKTQNDYVLNIQANNNYAEQIHIVANAETESIKDTFDCLDFATLTACAKQIKKAKKILFFGMGTSFSVGLDASFKFTRLGKLALAMDNTHTTASILSSFTKDDVVFGITHSGETEETCKALAMAKSKNIPTVAIYTFPESKIKEYADYSFYTQTREIPKHRIAFSSRISQLFTLDALFIATLYEDKTENLQKIEEILSHF